MNTRSRIQAAVGVVLLVWALLVMGFALSYGDRDRMGMVELTVMHWTSAKVNSVRLMSLTAAVGAGLLVFAATSPRSVSNR